MILFNSVKYKGTASQLLYIINNMQAGSISYIGNGMKPLKKVGYGQFSLEGVNIGSSELLTALKKNL